MTTSNKPLWIFQVSCREFFERIAPDAFHSHLLPGSTGLLVPIEYFEYPLIYSYRLQVTRNLPAARS